jgi:hypothetical protein
MLYAVLEEAERAVVEVEQHSHTISLLVGACTIGALLAVAPEGATVSANKPAIGAATDEVCSFRVEVGLADADEDVGHMLRQQLHLPIVLALC